jgi:hypothetical protein
MGYGIINRSFALPTGFNLIVGHCARINPEYWEGPKALKFIIITQRVKVPPDESVTGRSAAKSGGKPGNGSPEPDGVRMQAVSLSPEKGIIVDIG